MFSFVSSWKIDASWKYYFVSTKIQRSINSQQIYDTCQWFKYITQLKYIQMMNSNQLTTITICFVVNSKDSPFPKFARNEILKKRGRKVKREEDEIQSPVIESTLLIFREISFPFLIVSIYGSVRKIQTIPLWFWRHGYAMTKCL